MPALFRRGRYCGLREHVFACLALLAKKPKFLFRARKARLDGAGIGCGSGRSTLAEALKPVINAVLSALKKLWKVSAKAIGVPPKWLHLAAHAKKARTRKKYRNRIRRYVFEALAAEGGGGP